MTDELDDALRRALQPVEPPHGFTQRVMARLAPAQRRTLFSRWRIPFALAASALLAIGLYAGIQQHHRQQLAGLEARRKVIEALRLTDQKLDIAYQTVKDESGI